MDTQITSVIIGALLGGAISSLSFFLKNKRETKEKINESLFQLLEVWSIITMIKVTHSDKFHTILIERIKEKFPNENIDDTTENLLRKEIVKSLPTLTGLNGNFLEKYLASVHDLAKIHPLLAFELKQNQMLIRLLGELDKLFDGIDEGDEIKEMILPHIRELFLNESFTELESDLITLASKSGYKNKAKTKKYVDIIRNRLDEIPSDIFDEYIAKVISPAVQQYYDSHGIENPNIPSQ